MTQSVAGQYTAFIGARRVSVGPLRDVAIEVKRVVDAGEHLLPVIFDDVTSQVVDIDFRGTNADVVARLAAPTGGSGEASDEHDTSPYLETTRPRGRPKLGVVAREVTLLPRHSDWLAAHPGGASAPVRRSVDAARQASAEPNRLRQAKESAHRFMSAMAGNEAGFEEATRALFALDPARFLEMTESWPEDVRDHARGLAARAFANAGADRA